MWNKDNLEESLSLMNISNQRTLRATSCEITKESADSERPGCTCYFKDLNLKGEERLACCSDNHDPNCEQGYHFFITVLGNSQPTAMKPTVNKSTTASDYVRSTLSPPLHHMSSSHGSGEAAVLPGDLGFYTESKTTVFAIVITACCLILGIPVVYVVYRRIKGSRRMELVSTVEN
ncbi:hypothetical protein BSL78_14030 [Apostichopus japonicus]|uniref:Uncharacterized protein n=1 Tax=Stichopus japonicus TaxID=307972 RepID=A0A2G8KM47_STIJA|nr:hypothetical protein BSL78_14030 [Apostichopus japonicus]